MQNLNSIYQQIAAIGRHLGAARVVLFGSRARGDCRERSDIDIAVGVPLWTRWRNCPLCWNLIWYM